MRKTRMVITLLIIAIGIAMMQVAHAGGAKGSSLIDTTPASTTTQTIDGKLLKIDGDFYVIEDLNGKQARLQVNKETKQLSGQKKPGDSVRAEINRNGQILSIQ